MDVSPVVSWLLGALGVVVFALVVIGIGQLVTWVLRSRRPALSKGWRRSRVALGMALLFSGLRVVWRGRTEIGEHLDTVLHVLLIGAIIGWVWFVASVVLVLIDLGLRRTPALARDAAARRRIVTQLQLIRRLVTVFFVVVGIGGVLLTFPGVDKLGGGILASAGLLSVIAGLAAQSSLANMFAGIQMAFSQALRIGDTVVVEDEYGYVEDITLTYVVIKIWDERRLVLPTTYFSTTPYTNWTREGEAVIGTVYLNVDWRVDMTALRDQVMQYLNSRPEWDGVAGGLVMTDARNGLLEIRASVSARDADELWVLQVGVREHLATWIRDHDPAGIPGYHLREAPPAELPDERDTPFGARPPSAAAGRSSAARGADLRDDGPGDG